MVLATITGYSVGVFIHILAVVLAFGPTFGLRALFSVLPKYPRAAPAFFEAIRKVDTLPGQPGDDRCPVGRYLPDVEGELGRRAKRSSPSASSRSSLSSASSTRFFRPQGRRAQELAERDLKQGDSFSPEFEEISRRLSMVGPLAGLIVVVTIFFMTVKP